MLATARDFAEKRSVDWRGVCVGFGRGYALTVDVVAGVDCRAGNFDGCHSSGPFVS